MFFLRSVNAFCFTHSADSEMDAAREVHPDSFCAQFPDALVIELPKGENTSGMFQRAKIVAAIDRLHFADADVPRALRKLAVEDMVPSVARSMRICSRLRAKWRTVQKWQDVPEEIDIAETPPPACEVIGRRDCPVGKRRVGASDTLSFGRIGETEPMVSQRAEGASDRADGRRHLGAVREDWTGDSDRAVR
jgi:hypothetical protein